MPSVLTRNQMFDLLPPDVNPTGWLPIPGDGDVKLHNAYPLTDAGRQAVEDLRGTTVHHASTTTDETEERGGKTWRTSTRLGFTSKTSAAQAASSY